MTEMEQYRIAVSKYAEEGVDGYLFHNRGDEHALIILSNIFLNAKSHIRIAANRLYNDEVVNTEEYIESMKVFLDKKDTHLSIIITNKPSKDEVDEHGCENTFYWMLYTHPAYRQGRIEIKNGHGKSFRNSNGDPLNFCTGDERMFRLEGDINKRQAIANFNDKEYTHLLNDAFDNVFEMLDEKVDLKEYYTKK